MTEIAKLIAVSRPVIGECNTAEELVAYVARVSNPSNQNNTGTANKLLKYLIDNQHWSPLEMVHIVIEINTTRDIARQILRHRSFSFQEFSQRYAKASDLGFVTREARLQDPKNRQASNETNDEILKQTWLQRQNYILDEIENAYAWALDQGIAKEQARAILPEGLTKSRLYMAGTLRSWVHYCLLRKDVATQKEHREVALACLEILKKEFPAIAGLTT